MTIRVLKSIVLLLWFAFFLWLLTAGSDDLGRLLHPRLWWIVAAGAIIMLLFGINTILSGDPHQHQGFPWEQVPALIILVLPLLFFLVAREARFDASTLDSRIAQDQNGTFQRVSPQLNSSGSRTDDGDQFGAVMRNPENFLDTKVDLVCQSLIDDRLPENVAMCYRYLMTCCAADAIPLFILLHHSGEVALENDRWIKVRGEITLAEEGGVEVPSLVIESVDYVEEPKYPWVF